LNYNNAGDRYIKCVSIEDNKIVYLIYLRILSARKYQLFANLEYP